MPISDMTTSDNPDDPTDRWAELDGPEAVAAAAGRLRQITNAPSEIAAQRRFLDLLAPGPGEHVLDVGAGTGEITLELIRRVQPDGAVTALDPSHGLLAIAQTAAQEEGLNKALTIDIGDARDLPYADDRFDIAFCHWVLLHVEPPEDVIREMARVVRPGGRLMCVEVDWETMTISPGDRDLVRHIVRANVDRQIDGQIGRRLVSMFRQAGLQNVRVEPIVDVDCDGDQDGWLEVLKSRIPVVVDSGLVSSQEAQQWWSEVEEAVARGDYFFSLTQFAVVGQKPN